MPEICGVQCPRGTSELDAQLVGLKTGNTNGTTLEDRFWAIADILWGGTESAILPHPWAETTVEKLVEGIRRPGDDAHYLGIAGCASCVSGDTRMLNPLTGEQPTIQELCEQGVRPTVMTLNGPVLADVPYLKGRAELFEFELSHGEKIKVTAQHRFLTPSGWQHASDVSVAAEIYGYDLVLRVVAPVQVLSIRSLGVSDFYDLNVPVEHHYFANGCINHNSGKSRLLAAWGIVMWMCDPLRTSLIFTSTSIKEARQRIWGDVTALWGALEQSGVTLPGKLVDSHNIIRYAPDGINHDPSQKRSIMLVACAYGEERKAIRKLIGFKMDRVFLIADELPDLPDGILKAAVGNMASNARKGTFQMVGIGNPASKLDAFGKFIAPKVGWPDLDDKAEEWEGRYGTVIRFDAEKSPLLDMEEIPKGWEFLPSAKSLAKDREIMADDEWWRMNRAWFAPGGERDAAYTEDELMEAVNKCPDTWVGEPTMCAAMDPAYKSGGDRIVVTFGKCGMTSRKMKQLEVVESVEIPTPGDGPALFEMVEGFVEKCAKYNIEPWNTAIDETGGGTLIADALAIVWSQHVLRVNFGGSASSRVSGLKNKPAAEQFANRVGELWLGGKPFFHAKQIWGLTQKHVTEMTRRKTAAQRGARWSLQTVEPKKSMKSRTGRSPDYADSLFILIELAQTRLGLVLDPSRRQARDQNPEDWEQAAQVGHLHNPDNELETLQAV